jgi:hypothetical protein
VHSETLSETLLEAVPDTLSEWQLMTMLEVPSEALSKVLLETLWEALLGTLSVATPEGHMLPGP